MEKSGSAKNITVRLNECTSIKLQDENFPSWLVEALLDASNAISVAPDALLHFIISTVNYAMLHSEIHIDGMDWSEPVI